MASAQGDHWEPWTARRIASPEKSHYAVLQSTGEKRAVRLRLVHSSAENRATVTTCILQPTERNQGDRLDPLPGDNVLFDVVLQRPPADLRVLDSGAGVYLFETWGAYGSGTTLALHGTDGKVRWSHALGDLFDAETLKTFTITARERWWSRGWFVVPGEHVVLAAKGGHFLKVDEKDGAVEPGDANLLRAPIVAGSDADRVPALDLALQDRPLCLDDAASMVLKDKAASLAAQLRASWGMQLVGKGKADADLFRRGIGKEQDWDTRIFAVRHLGGVLGEEALPLLQELLRGEADATWRPAIAALGDVGEPAVPALLSMLDEKNQHLDYYGAALLALGGLKAENALPRLWKQVVTLDRSRDEHHFLPLSALRAVVAIAPADLDERLSALLAEGTPLDGDIAVHYRRNPSKKVVAGLIAAMDHRGPYRWERQQLVKALKACTGEDHGNDPAAWRKALGLDR
ncbi:MAG: HEAT repeat domain-containing protein [Planctomycetota bacterium]